MTLTKETMTQYLEKKASEARKKAEAKKLKEEMLRMMADKPIVMLKALKDGRYRVI